MLRLLSKLVGAMLATCLYTQVVQAATINAASPALTDVSAAIASAANGDTVVIPPGTSSWSSSLTINKCITLRGQGTNSTRISRQGDLLVLAPTVNLPMRITGIYFDLGPFYNSSDRSAISLMAENTNLRIDHCYFRGGDRTIWIRRKGYGVIDHCTFYNCNEEIQPWQDDPWDDGGNASWALPVVPGTVNTITIEDCNFVRDNNITADPNSLVYGQNGTRCTFRYNTVTQTGTSRALAAVDAHGYDASWGRGSRFYEVYNNTFNCAYTYRFCYLRGGTHIFFGNKFIMGSGDCSAIQLCNEGQNDGNAPVTQDVITNSFFWNNTLNGVGKVPDIESGTTTVSLNTHYFNRQPQPGDIWYPYTPLVYPHPRVTLEDGGASTNPVVVVSPSSRNYGSVPVGSTNDLTFTVQNVGGGILSGTASVTAPFTIVGSGTYSLASNALTSITVRYIPTTTGSNSGTVTFTGGGGAIASVSGSGWSGALSFAAPQGTITAPFVVNPDNTISQSVTTDDPASGGEAVYTFTLAAGGEFGVSAQVYAPDDGANSFFINIDAEPVSPTMIWDVPAYAGFTNRVATWRGSGVSTEAAWALSAGSHNLIIRGREPGAKLGQITIVPKLSPPTNLRLTTLGN